MAETPHGGTRGPADDERLGAVDRSLRLLPDRKEGMSWAHRAQEQERITRRLRCWAADSHQVGMRVASSKSMPTRENGGRSHSAAIPGKARNAEPRPGDPHRDRGRLRKLGRWRRIGGGRRMTNTDAESRPVTGSPALLMIHGRQLMHKSPV